jgi:hypothetical protein
MTWAGCYSLDLYCDREDEAWPNGRHSFQEFPHQYTAETGGECRAQARKAGWLVGKKGSYAICPKCSGKERK